MITPLVAWMLAPIVMPVVMNVPPSALPEVIVDRDNIVVRESCTLRFSKSISDDDGNGVVHIEGDGITVDLGAGTLASSADAATPEKFSGMGIVLRAKNVTLRNGAVRGFKVAISASACDGSTFEQLNVSGNYAQRLLSTFEAENSQDWLFPHQNDEGQWATQHGAGLSVSNASKVVLRQITSHATQNGILLSRVVDSQIYDNDCSFLSGWGLAMWRSSGNTICRNNFDFCVRGYSHTVYNRGQDSAGILLFEQCSENIIALNSATHCGDGVFAFAGREALGETPAPMDASDASDPKAWYRTRGNNFNQFIGNDLSCSAAHGLELTFSFSNRIEKNRFESNAICGIWGGYSAQTRIEDNDFVRNGDAASGGERGGINIEHGRENLILANHFESNAAGVVLWNDVDEALSKTPWAKANGTDCSGNKVVSNTFTKDKVGIELREARDTVLAANTFVEVAVPLLEQRTEGTQQHDDVSLIAAISAASPTAETIVASLPGSRQAVGMREKTRGRFNILMERYGPYAFDAPRLARTNSSQEKADYRTLGFTNIVGVDIVGRGPVRILWGSTESTVRVIAEDTNFVTPYELIVRDNQRHRWIYRDILAPVDWTLRLFATTGDPLTDPALVARDGASASAIEFTTRSLNFDFGAGTPGSVIDEPKVRDSGLGADHFGMIAKANPTFLAGKYAIVITSDDGIRLKVDGKVVLEHWDRHTPTADRFVVTLTEPRPVPIEIEWFELDGNATFKVHFESVEPDIPDMGQSKRSTRMN